MLQAPVHLAVDHQDLALVLGLGEGHVGQLLDVLAVVVVEGPVVLALGRAVLVFIGRHLAAQAIRLWFSCSLKFS